MRVRFMEQFSRYDNHRLSQPICKLYSCHIDRIDGLTDPKLP
jgi:hypothetical protein